MRLRIRVRWRRLMLVVFLVLAVAVGSAAFFVASVPLPNDPVVPQASELYYSDGRTVLARVGVDNRTDVRLAQVPVHVRHAVLAAEDHGFYDHYGISTRGVARAAWSNVSSDSSQGASTITQQYVRNAYLTQERNLGRKAKEMALALKIEHRYTKDELLSRYLNTIYFGRGAYGIQAAAQAYFGVTVDRLTLEQGAVLAAVIKDPWNFDPAVDGEQARQRWRWVLAGMAELGWADRRAVAAARYPEIQSRTPANAGPLGLIVDIVEGELSRQGIVPQILRTAGLRVVTTVDKDAEDAAIAAVRATLRDQPAGLRAALVAIEPDTGAVRAYYGGDQGPGYFDDATAVRPPASTFKPFVLAEALRQGISYQSRWDGSSPRLFPGRLGVPLYNRDDLQCPDCGLDEAMVLSLNTPFYAVAERVGAARIRQLAIDLGVPPTYGKETSLVDQQGDPRPGQTRPDIALGRYPVAPVDLASAYATLAAGGTRVDRHVVQSAKSPDGTQWYRALPNRRQVLTPQVAADVTTVLAKTLNFAGGLPRRPAAGKTGTQQWGDTADNQDAWMAGYTPQLAAVVWIGRSVPGPIRDSAGRPVEGHTLPTGLWRQFMSGALADDAVAALPPPAHVGRTGAGDTDRVGRGGDEAVRNFGPGPSSGPTVKPTRPVPPTGTPAAPERRLTPSPKEPAANDPATANRAP